MIERLGSFLYTSRKCDLRECCLQVSNRCPLLSHTPTQTKHFISIEKFMRLWIFDVLFVFLFVLSFYPALTFHSHRRVFPPVCVCMSMDSQFIHILRMENTHVNRHFAIFFLSFFFNAVQIFDTKKTKEKRWNDTRNWMPTHDKLEWWFLTMVWINFRGWFLFGLGCVKCTNEYKQSIVDTQFVVVGSFVIHAGVWCGELSHKLKSI